MNTPRPTADEIFCVARAIDSPEKRLVYLDGACANDAGLRAHVDALLAVDADVGSFLALTPDPDATIPKSAEAGAQPPSTERPGQIIGRFKLLQQIGEGGFGSVFMAEQREPVVRKVALKIIKLGMDTRQVVARFEQERQALAMMDHPNIAKVLDAGATETGRPYFVMELVKGDPIVEYCDKNNLRIEDRLELFAQVCIAVQHAHTKGIIHRDLKPNNILVSTQDGRPHTKVIDFGIAKATTNKLTEKTLFTEHRQLIGTPEYMSPEQAEGNLDIDTRTDVYSLGVLLYELLTGTTPFSGKELRSVAYAEIQRIIREVEPPKPSTRISHNSETIANVAAKRNIEPRRLGTTIRGELDWIAMKAMEKDRQRRYETANGLAMDVRRYLSGEAVVAAPPSTAYRFKKFIRRHRVMVSAGGAVALALLIGVAAFAWQANVAMKQRRIAVENEALAVSAARKAELAETRAVAAQAAATEQRDLAQSRLYESLVREAIALRLNPKLGYRRECLDRLRQAAAISVPQRDLALLNAEASRCLGDPIGLDPVVLSGNWVGGSPGKAEPVHAIHPQGTVVARGTATGLLSIYNAESGTLDSSFEDQGSFVDIAFAPSSFRLFGIVQPKPDADGPDRLALVEWRRDGAGRWILRAVPPVKGITHFLAASGDVVAAALTPAGTFDLIDADSRRVLGSVPGHPYALASNRRLVAHGTDVAHAIDLRNLGDGTVLARLDPQLGSIKSVQFNDDASYLVCWCETGLAVYDTIRFEKAFSLRGYFSKPAFLNRLTLLMPFPQEEVVRFFNVATNSEIARLAMGSWDIRVGDESQTVLAIGKKAQVVRLGDTPERRRLIGHVGGVPAVDFSPDEKQVASIGKDRTIRIWDVATGKAVKSWDDLDGPGQAVAFHPDGHLILSAEWGSSKIRLWSAADARPVITLQDTPDIEANTYSASFSRDGRYLAATGSLGMRVWELHQTGDLAGPTVRATLVRSVKGQILAHQFNGESTQICYIDAHYSQPATYLLQLDSQESEPQQLFDYSGTIGSLSFAPRDKAFASISGTKRVVEIWKPRSPEHHRTLPTIIAGESITGGVNNLSVSPDCTMLAVANGTGRGVNVLDLSTGRRLVTLPDEQGTIWWLAWSPDSTRLAVSRSQGDVSIWNLPAAQAILREAGLAGLEGAKSASDSAARGDPEAVEAERGKPSSK